MKSDDDFTKRKTESVESTPGKEQNQTKILGTC